MSKHFSAWRGFGGGPLPMGYAATVEEAGFRRLWLGGPVANLANAEQALAETEYLWLASGILNIWTEDATTVAASYHRLEERYPGRFVLGIGTSHPEYNAPYAKPVEAMQRYLDVLDREGIPIERRVLAALGPRVMKLAGERAAGAHPYFVPPAHSAMAREILGPSKLLIPEHKVVLDTDQQRARALARDTLGRYLGFSNYVNNCTRLGFTDEDVRPPGSDRLVDATVSYGTPDQVVAGLAEHLAAGADEVAVQLLSSADDHRAELLTLGASISRWEAARAR